MNKSILLAGLASLLIGGGVFVGCSSDSDDGDGTPGSGGAGATGGENTGATGNNGGAGPTSSSAGPGPGGAGPGGSGGEGGGPTVEADCEAPEVAASAGACVIVEPGGGGAGGGGGGIECNPVTGEPCDIAGGASCDTGADENGNLVGFQCYDPPNDVELCGACDYDAGMFCVGTTTCQGGTCLRYCCTDADCGPGATCATGSYDPVAPDLGVCIVQ